MNKRFIFSRFINILTLFVLCLISVNSSRAQSENRSEKSLAVLFEEFKTARKMPCGERAEALRIGKLIVEKYRADELNREVIEYVKIQTDDVEREEKRCRAGDLYAPSRREDIIPKAKQLLVELKDIAAALDVMLDVVSAGYDDLVVYKNKTYVNDTYYYGKQAIQLLEAGQLTNSQKYGAMIPFGSRENALGWMHYIVGWIMYHEMNQQKEALGYFYKALQFEGEKKNDLNIYTTLGIYYFDEAVRLDTEYREKRKALVNLDSEETKALSLLAGIAAERAMEFSGRAYILAVERNLAKNLVNNLYRTLNDLYYFRFKGLPDYKKNKELDEYLEQLKNRPLTDFKKTIESQESLDEKLRRLPR